MLRITKRIVLGYLASAFVFAAVAVPAAGAIDIPTAKALVWGVVTTADSRNQLVLNQFVSDAALATTKAQLDAARTRGHNALDVIWYDSIAQLDDLLELFPIDLAGDVSSAKAKLLTDHDAAHAEIESIYNVVIGSLPPNGTTTTTTTQPPTSTTTTTTKPPTSTTTTTTKPPTSSTTTTAAPPASTTTTTLRPTTTTTVPDPVDAESTSTTTTTPAAVLVGGGSSGTGRPVTTQALATVIGLADPATSNTPVFAAQNDSERSLFEGMTDAMRKHAGMVSAAVSSGAAVVLPERLVQIAVAPIVLIEMLVGTLFASLLELIVPIALLAAAMAWFVWRETRRGGVLSRPS